MNPLSPLGLLAASNQSPLTGLILPLALLGPLMYMMIVPQRKQRKKAAEMLASLKVGDEVVTSGGIHGVVTFLEDSVGHVEVDTDVVIRVSKSALTRVSANADVDVEPEVADVTDRSAPAGADAADGPAASRPK